MKKRYFVLLLILGFGIAFWVLLRDASAPTVTTANTSEETSLAPDVPPAEKDDLIIVETPLPQSTVSSPLVIRGKARGNWYFEASFPILLIDSAGNMIAEGHVTAQGDWMTTEYVPFTASLSYTLPKGVTSGFLFLKKDNPSGEAQFDNALRIPVTFK